MTLKLRISREELQLRRLFVATPMYGGQCYGHYVYGLLDLKGACAEHGISMRYFALMNESQVNRARNYCVYEFMRSDATHLLFIDADIEFDAGAVLMLLALADPASDKDVVCGLYPRKRICWDKVAAAAPRIASPSDLSRFGGDLCFNPIGLSGSYDLWSPLEATEVGTGFMMIQRRVIDRFTEAYPKMGYASDGLERTDGATGIIPCCFENYLDQESCRLLTEDFNFCRLIRAAGMKVWVAPWINLNHLGFYRFEGNPAALSLLGEPAAVAA